MKILITGAEVEKNGSVYEVIYRGRVVFSDRLRDVCLCVGLNSEKLEQLLLEQPQVYKFRVA